MIQSLDAVFRTLAKNDQEWLTYRASVEENQRELAKFYRLDRAPRQAHDASTTPAQADQQFFRIWWRSTGTQRLEQFGSWDAIDKSDPIGVWYFNGRLWQGYWPGARVGPSVDIDNNRDVPAALQLLGLAYSKLASRALLASDICPADSVLQFSRFLSWASAERCVYDGPTVVNDALLGPGLRIVLVMPERYGTHSKIEFWFSPARGYAPVRIVGSEVDVESGKVVPVTMAVRYLETWDAFYEPLPGLWIAKKFQLERWGDVYLPASKKGFEPLLEDGKPVLKRGVERIDMTKTVSREYKLGQTTCDVVRCDINRDVSQVLREPQYPAGTIVNNHVTGEVYQLTGVSPAIDAVLRRTLEGKQVERETSDEQPTQRRGLIALIAINVVVVLLVGATLYVRRRRRKRSSVG